MMPKRMIRCQIKVKIWLLRFQSIGLSSHVNYVSQIMLNPGDSNRELGYLMSCQKRLVMETPSSSEVDICTRDADILQQSAHMFTFDPTLAANP